MQTITLSSPDFSNGKPIPEKCAYYSANHSPQLEWKTLPPQVKSLALVVEDPDAPSGLWIHWVIYNIPASLSGMPAGVKKSGQVPGIGTQGNNDFVKTGYDGPCPPRGKAHRYYFKLFALDANLDLLPGLTRQELLHSIAGHIVAEGQWMGTYQSS